jgi:hypothetical protein
LWISIAVGPKTGTDVTSMMNTAALGAAYRALWVIHENGAKISTSNLESGDNHATKVVFITAARPRLETRQIYTDLLERYKSLEQIVVAQLSKPCK